jgi:hypothetical protein
VLLFETFFSGASSLSRTFDDTEDELEDIIEYIDKKINIKEIFNKRK